MLGSKQFARIVVSALVLLALAAPAAAQLNLSTGGVAATIDFTGFTGAGFQPSPTASQLSSNTWRMSGWTDGALAYGGTQTTATTDYTRGSSAVAVTTGGVYAFSISGNVALGFQQGASDFDPGVLGLRVKNVTGSTVTSLSISYKIYYRNDQTRASTFNLSHSADDTTWTALAALDFASPASGTAGTGWSTATTKTTTISGLSIANNAYYYFKWDTVSSGSGSRDELAIDDISITPTVAAVADTTSYVAAPASQITGDFLPSDATVDAVVAAYKIVDVGADGYAMTVTNLRFTPGATNTADWTNTLKSAKLCADAGCATVLGTATTALNSITDTDISFSGLNISVPNAGNTPVYLAVSFAETGLIVDWSVLSFKIDSSQSGNAATGSSFATSGVTPVTSQDWVADVAVLALFTEVEPAHVIPGMPFSFSVVATDWWGNLDTDYAADVVVALNLGSGTLSSATYPNLISPALGGVATWPDLMYDAEDTLQLIATDGSGVIDDAISSTWVASLNLDASGYKVGNLDDATTVTLPAGTILAPGDYIVIGRDADQASFQTGWSITLAANVHYFQGKLLTGGSTNGFPVVNASGAGSERLQVLNASSVVIDGPSPAALAFGNGDDCVRTLLTGNGQLAGDWTCGLNTVQLPTPGSGTTVARTGKLLISEMGDATTFNYEFVELFYDAEVTSVCGNGQKEFGEPCDDGANGNASDGCKDNCTFSCNANGDCTDTNLNDCLRPACVAGGNGKLCEGGDGTAAATDGSLCDVGVCSAGACVPSDIGGVLITEFMPRPGHASQANCSDAAPSTASEWFEIHNIRAAAIDMTGWKFKYEKLDAAGVATYTYTSSGLGSTSIAAGAYLLVCPAATPAGGLNCAITNQGFSLGNSGATSIRVTVLDDVNTVIDSASYLIADVGVADNKGRSYSLSPCHLRGDLNDNPAVHWCKGSDFDTFTCGSGNDLGTPGAANRPCPNENCYSCDNPAVDCTNTSGDCKDALCVPSGADWVCGTRNNDSDVLDDGLACTADLCTNGVASHESTAGLPCKTDAGLPSDDGWCTLAGACVANTCGDGYKFSTEACDDHANGDPDDGCKADCTFSCPTLGAACTDAIADDCTYPKCTAGGNGQLCEPGAGSGLIAQGTACAGGGQCDASGNCTVPATPGDVIVNEINMNPTACDTVGNDGAGEWFELKNVSSHAVNLVGWKLSDNEATYTVPAAYTLLPGALAVFCNDAAKPAWCTFSYSGVTIRLGNGGDKLTVKDGFGTTIDEVAEFVAAWPVAVTSPVSGVSLALDPSRATAAKNDYGWSWCAGQGALACGDTGSPGAANADCAGGLIVPADAAHSTVKATTNVAADGHSHAIVSVELKAVDDTPAYNRSLAFGVADASAAIVDPTGGAGTVVTDANGRAVVYVTDSQAEAVTVSITDLSPAPKVTLTGPAVTFVAPTSGTSASVNGVGLTVTGGTFTQAAAYDPASMPPGLPDGVVLPYGVIATTISVPAGGAQATVSYTLPARVVQSYRLYKFGSEAGAAAPHWYAITANANVTNFKDPYTTFTVKLTDGGFGDADGVANGVIVDPTSIVQDPAAIPTLGEWAVLLLALVLAAVAVGRLRRVRSAA